jgi:hypothetical protein
VSSRIAITIIVTDHCRFCRVGYNNDSAKQAGERSTVRQGSEIVFITILGKKLVYAFAA